MFLRILYKFRNLTVTTVATIIAKLILPHYSEIKEANIYRHSQLSDVAERKLEAHKFCRTKKCGIYVRYAIHSIDKLTISKWVGNVEEPLQKASLQFLEPKPKVSNNTLKEQGTNQEKDALIQPKGIVKILLKKAVKHFPISIKCYIINKRTIYIINAVDLVTRMIFGYTS